MNKLKHSNFYKWSVEKGDYKRDEDTTLTHWRKQLWKKRIKITGWFILYISFVIVLSYLIFSNH